MRTVRRVSPLDTAQRVEDLLDRLTTTDLHPCPEVDALFGHLVSLALATDDEQALATVGALGPDVDRLRAVCGRGETLLEMSWAQRIRDAADPRSELDAFPYTENYRLLSRLELHAAQGVGAGIETVTVLGSGPLPLTALCYAWAGCTVTAVERDPASWALGRQVVDALGAGDRVQTLLADADAVDLDDDLVVLAALVGADADQKARMLDSIARRCAVGTHVLVRSAVGGRALLYPPAPDPHDVTALLAPLVEVHPRNEVVNSVLLYRRVP